MNRISHWIDGKVSVSTSGRSGVVFDPATGEQQASVDFASVAEVDHAIAVAKAAFPAWRATNLSRRAEVMFHMRELVAANRKEIASILSKEHGKVLGDALGEVLLAELVEQEADAAAVHAEDRAVQRHVAMQRLQHEAVAAERYNHIGGLGLVLTIAAGEGGQCLARQFGIVVVLKVEPALRIGSEIGPEA